MNLLKNFFSIILIFCLCGCNINEQNHKMIVDSSTNYYNKLYEYIYNEKEEKIYMLDKTISDWSCVASGKTKFMKGYNDNLYYIEETNNKLVLKCLENNITETIYEIPLNKIEGCILHNDCIYMTSGSEIYVFDLSDNTLEMIVDNITGAKCMAIYNDCLYYNEVSDDFNTYNDDFMNTSGGYVLPVINKLNLHDKQSEVLLKNINNSQCSDVIDILSTNKGIVGYFNVAFTNNIKQILLVNEQGDVKIIKDSIYTDIDYMATDRDNIYYVDSIGKKIKKINLNNNDCIDICDYSDYIISDVLGITSEHIYFVNESGEVYRYNINSKSYQLL